MSKVNKSAVQPLQAIHAMPLRAIAAAALLLGSASASAQLLQYNWDGSAGTDFLDPENWTAGGIAAPGQVPGEGALANISAAGVAVLDGATHKVATVQVGQAGQGRLQITGGGVLEAARSGTSFGSINIGANAASGGNGGVTVSGVGSRLVAAVDLTVGQNATGFLTLENGGAVQVGGAFNLGGVNVLSTAAVGTLNIGSGAGDTVGGSVTASAIKIGIGQATLNFDHASTELVFTPGIVMQSATDGIFVLNHLRGTTRLAGDLDYRGNTVVSGGHLALGGASMKIDGDVTVGANATLATGLATENYRAARTLHILGDLLMDAGSTFEMGLGSISSDPDPESVGLGDLVIVDGTLRLNGTLNIFDIGDGSGNAGFGLGRYELFKYGEFDADNSDLDIVGSLPGGLPGTLSLDTNNQRIILSIDAGIGDTAWWGLSDGDWSQTSESWSVVEGRTPPLMAWSDGALATFNGPGGDVSLTEDVVVSGLSIEADGYVIADGGGVLKFDPGDENQSTVRIGVMSGARGEIAAQLEEGRSGLSLIKHGTGTLVLSHDDNQWSGETRVDQGTLQIGNGGSSGALPGNVSVTGTLAFDRSDTHIYGGTISGSGTLRQIGDGTLVLTGNGSGSGRTVVESGTLQVGNGGTSGSLRSGAVDIHAGATLAFNRAGEYEFGNDITGSGSVAQRGGGLLLLSGNLGSFAGTLRAEQGRIELGAGGTYGGNAEISDRMVVNGTLTGAVTVRAGGVLGGTGSVRQLTVDAGGAVAPGNSIGRLNVSGPVLFNTGSFYDVEANNANAADQIAATGNVTLDGTVRVSASPGDAGVWQPYNDYVILSYGGNRAGTFAGVESDLAFLDPSLRYDPGVVTLRLNRNDIAFGDIGLSANQRAAGAALQALGLDHTVASQAVRLHDQVQGMTHDDARAAFDAVSGEIHASLTGMLLSDSRLVREPLLARAAAVSGGGSNNAQVWARGVSHKGEAEGQGVSTFERSTSGVLVGADHGLGEHSGLGWVVGHHRSNRARSEVLNSEGDVKSAHAGAYVGSRSGDVGMRLGLAHSWHELTVAREIAFAGEGVGTQYDARTWQMFAELDVDVRVADQKLSPFVNVAWTQVAVDGFMEADFSSPIGNTAGLRAGSDKHSASFATVGTRAELSLGPVLAQGLVGYQRTLSGEQPQRRVGFLDGNGAFDVVGAPLARDAFVADVGLSYRLGERVDMGVAYNGLLGSDARDHAVEARVSIVLP